MIDKTISHYRIIEKLGEGGMGVVYKAEDTKLERMVALKFLSPNTLGTDEEKARFAHEAKSAAALNHPNICTVYEIDEVDRETFIAMALIEGESLTAKIARGPLGLDETIDLAVQVGEGLAAAHEKGIVHRDMKPGNVMVTAKGRAKIMDFGLAKSAGQTKLTRTGATTGTAAYMSPEQSRGEGVDHRTDIWSFGVMLYEMTTGQRPFGGEYEQALVYSIMNEDPAPITGLRTGVPMELERIVMKAMAKRPEERYQHVEDMLVDLRALQRGTGVGSAAAAPATRGLTRAAPPAARRRSIPIVVGAVTVAVVAAVFALVQLRSPPAELDPKRVVVAALENQTGDPSADPLGVMIADWIAEGLSQIGDVEVVSVGRPRVATDEGTPAPDDVKRLLSLAEDAGAGVIVSGTYYAAGEDLRFQIRMMNATDGSITYAPPAVGGSRETATDDLEALRQRIMGAVATEFDPSLSSQPPMYEAYQEYETASRIFAADYAECIRRVNRAIEIDPAYTSARLYLAIAYGNIGRWAEADSIISEIAVNREKLSPYEQQMLGWHLAHSRGDLEGGLRHLREARRLNPESVLANYVGGLYCLYLNRPGEARDAFDATMSITESVPKAHRVHWSWGYVAAAHAYHMLGEHERELELVRQGLRVYPELSLLRASEAQALAALHRVGEVREIVDRSMAVASEYGSPFWVMEQAAHSLRAHGHLEESIAIANLAVDWCRSRPVEERENEELQFYLANALYLAERWEEAIAVFEGLAARSPEDFHYVGAIGTLAARRGDREEALRICAELEGLEGPHMFGTNIYWCACISAILGEREQALAFLREAFSRGLRHYGHVDVRGDMDLESLHGYPPFEEFVRPKG